MNKFYLFLIVLMIFPITHANTYLTRNSSWENGLTKSWWTSIVVGDLNNDGWPDLVQIGCIHSSGYGYCNGYAVKVYINNGTSFVESSTWESNLTPVHYGSLALGDINNDGLLDLALSGCLNGGGSSSACPNQADMFSDIYINNGTSFIESSSWKSNIPGAWKSSFAFGDINNDGKLDLILSGGSDVPGILAKVYVNNGTSFKEDAFWEKNLIPVYGSSTTLVDVDNDGRLDLFLVGDSGSGYVAKAYINNGTSFVENSTWEQNLLGVELASTTWGDIDNNGRMDFSLIGHTSSDNHEIYNNTGTSLIRINKNYPYGGLSGIFEGTQAFGDYNNDGKLDLFTSGEEHYSTLFINTGANFTDLMSDPESDIFNSAYGPGAIWCDVNNDSTLDLILIGSNYDILDTDAAVYTNNITTKNTPPNPPATLSANYSNGVLNLSWSVGSDAETAALGLYYNLRVGTTSGGNQIVTGVYGGGDDNGYFGNMMQRRNIFLNLPNLSGTIYWSVQTIDTGLKAGTWANERIFNITNGNQTNQTTDTTAPILSIDSPANNSLFTTSSVAVSATYSDANTVTCTAKLDSGSQISMSGGGATSGTVTHTFNSIANGQHIVYVNCTDSFSNRVVKNSVFNVSVYAAPPPAGSGSGSGGGGGGLGGLGGLPTNKTNTTKPIQQNTTIANIVNAVETKIELAHPVIKEVEMHSAITDIHIDTNDIAMPEIPIIGNVYNYIEITPNVTVANATLTFEVAKSWLSDNNINKTTIKLNRYSDSWNALDTILISENETTVVYQAITPGFSVFAITGEKNLPPPPDNVAPVDLSGYYWVAGIALVLFAAVGGFYYYKHLPKKEPVPTAAPA